MSGSRSTRKVTIDSGRRISTSGDLIEQQKKKSVFDRLGVSNSKPTVKNKTGKTKIINSETQDDEYNSDDNRKRKGLISFTVKKNSLVEDSENKLHMKKEKKKSFLPQDSEDEIVKVKKKKKQKAETAGYLKSKKNGDEFNDIEEDNFSHRKKNKAMISPDNQPTKKKRRFQELPVEGEDSAEDDAIMLLKRNSNKVNVRRKSLVEYQSGSETEEKERKKKKIKQPKDEPSKKNKRYEGSEEGIRKKKKKKSKSTEDEESEEERHYKIKNKKQRSPSWSLSEEDEPEVYKTKKKTKQFYPRHKQHMASMSASPNHDQYTSPTPNNRYEKEYSSFDSDISLESDDAHRNKKKKHREEVFQTFDDHKPSLGGDKYRRRDNENQFDQRQEYNKRQNVNQGARNRDNYYNRDDQFNDRSNDRARNNQFDIFKTQRNLDQRDDWRQNQYDDRNRGGGFNGRGGNRGRSNNRHQNDNRNDNRNERDQDYFRDDRRDDYRDNHDDWDRQGNYDDDRCNTRPNYRGRGRGCGRGNYHGNFNQYNNNANRFQPQDNDHRNQSYDRIGDQDNDRYQKHGMYRDNKDLRRDDPRGKGQKFEMSPIRDPNFIGGIAKRQDLIDSDDEQCDRSSSRKRKHSKLRNVLRKDDLSDSDLSDIDKTEKKHKSKVTKVSDTSRGNNEIGPVKLISKISKTVSNEAESIKSPPKTKEQNNEPKKSNSVEKKKTKKASHKRVAALKEREDSASTLGARKTPDSERFELESEKSDKKEENKRDRSVDSNKFENKRERNDKNRSQDIRGKSSDTRRRSPDSRRGKSPDSVARSPDSRRGRSPDIKNRSSDSRRGRSAERRNHSSDSRRGRSPEMRDSPYKRGCSPIRQDRNYGMSPVRNRDFNRRNSPSYNRKDSGGDREDKSQNKRDGTPLLGRNENMMLDEDKNADVYECISDEELDLFDEEDYKLPQPASVMEVDWSLLSSINKNPAPVIENESDVPGFLRKLSPGHVLADIGYSPSLLSKKTLETVQKLCLSARDIKPNSLDVSEETKLQTGMAVTVKNVLKQRRAKDVLFTKSLVGLRNDLALRRELRKPLDKIGIDFNIFCSAPSNTIDHEMFSNSVSLYKKQPQNDGDPLYNTISSKVGSIVTCKS